MPVRDWIDPTRLYNPATPAGRMQFLWGGVIYPVLCLLVATLLGGIATNWNQATRSLISSLWGVATWILFVLIVLRRLRDLHKSGWMILLLGFPQVNLLIWLYLFFRPTRRPAPAVAGEPAVGMRTRNATLTQQSKISK